MAVSFDSAIGRQMRVREGSIAGVTVLMMAEVGQASSSHSRRLGRRGRREES